jgi:hypothetical protein
VARELREPRFEPNQPRDARLIWRYRIHVKWVSHQKVQLGEESSKITFFPQLSFSFKQIVVELWKIG